MKKQDAKKVLKLLGLPTGQQSGVCCYSLLALLKLSSSCPWTSASNEWMRIHDILLFLRTNYRVRYAENSRETIRKQALHHFRTAAIIEDNGEATNSPNYCYRVTSEALDLFQSFGTESWDSKLKSFLTAHATLKEVYASKKRVAKVAVTVDGTQYALSAGAHNLLFDSPHAGRGWISFLNETLQLPNEHPFLAIDLFAGCGGLSLGFECAGVKTIGYEMKRECCETYRINLHSECRNEMLTEETEYPQADIVLGGPPCQPFSRRGKRKGRADARDGFPAYISAIRKLQPKIWVCENVKGLPELDESYFNSILGQFRMLGYQVDYKVVRMSNYDVPQKRERLVIVGHRGGFKFPEEAIHEVTSGEALADKISEIPEDAEFLTPSMDRYIASYEKASHCSRPRDLRLDEPARTLTCRNLAGCTSDMHRIRLADGRRRRLSVREAARLQSFPDWYEFSGTQEQQFTQIGNAVPPMFSYKLAQSVVGYLKN